MTDQTYYYKKNPYEILAHSAIKVNGEWKPVVIYGCLYDNPDGMIWTRFKEEFFELFKTKDTDDTSKSNR